MAIAVWQITGDGEAVAFEGWALVAIYVIARRAHLVRVSRPEALDFARASSSRHSPGARPSSVEPRVAAAVQAANRMADRLAHPPHLVLAALVQDELDARRGRAGARGPARCGRPRARPPRAAAGAPRRRAPLDVGDLVDLLDAVARMREPVRERAVVRQQQRAGRVDVEPPDRHDARLVADERDDGRPPLRVARGRDDAGRLVQEDVRRALLLDPLAVHLDDVACRRRTCSARRARRSPARGRP